MKSQLTMQLSRKTSYLNTLAANPLPWCISEHIGLLDGPAILGKRAERVDRARRLSEGRPYQCEKKEQVQPDTPGPRSSSCLDWRGSLLGHWGSFLLVKGPWGYCRCADLRSNHHYYLTLRAKHQSDYP